MNINGKINTKRKLVEKLRGYTYIMSYCYDIMPVRKEEGKSYWKIPFCDDDATREK